MDKSKLQQIAEAAKQLGWSVGSGVTVPVYLEQLERENDTLRVAGAQVLSKYEQMVEENIKALEANAALLEIIRNLRLDIETYKSTLEGLQRRVVRFEHIGNAIGEIV